MVTENMVDSIIEYGSNFKLQELKVILLPIYKKYIHDEYAYKDTVVKKPEFAEKIVNALRAEIDNFIMSIYLDRENFIRTPQLLCNLIKGILIKIDIYDKLFNINTKEEIR